MYCTVDCIEQYKGLTWSLGLVASSSSQPHTPNAYRTTRNGQTKTGRLGCILLQQLWNVDICSAVQGARSTVMCHMRRLRRTDGRSAAAAAHVVVGSDGDGDDGCLLGLYGRPTDSTQPGSKHGPLAANSSGRPLSHVPAEHSFRKV